MRGAGDDDGAVVTAKFAAPQQVGNLVVVGGGDGHGGVDVIAATSVCRWRSVFGGPSGRGVLKVPKLISADSSIRSPRMLNVIPFAVQRFVDLSMGVEASWPWNSVVSIPPNIMLGPIWSLALFWKFRANMGD